MTNLPGDNGKVDICGCSATLKVLEGQQEQEYLRQVGRMHTRVYLPPALC